MMLSCKDVTRLISESMDRRLPPGRRFGVRLHLFLCRFCARYERQLLMIRDTIRRIAVPEDPPAGLAPDTLSAQARERTQRMLGGP